MAKGANPYAAAAKVGGSLLGAYGSLLQGRSQARSYLAAGASALLSGQEEKLSLDFQADQAREFGAMVRSAQRAMFGHHGIELTGTAADLVEQTLLNSELDAKMLEREGRVALKSGQLQKQEYDRAAKDAKKAGKIGALSSIFGGFS